MTYCEGFIRNPPVCSALAWEEQGGHSQLLLLFFARNIISGILIGSSCRVIRSRNPVFILQPFPSSVQQGLT